MASHWSSSAHKATVLGCKTPCGDAVVVGSLPLHRSDDYLDFPVDYMFAAETLAKAYETQKFKGSLASVKAQGTEEGDAKDWFAMTCAKATHRTLLMCGPGHHPRGLPAFDQR